MGCKCNELSNWLEKEILLLEELSRASSKGSAYHHELTGKLEAFKTVFLGLTFD